MIKVGIVGGTGYTGVELLRLLALHPEVSLDVITSRSEEGVAVADMFPNLRGYVDLEFTVPDMERLKSCDLVFFATPNGIAMKMAPELLDAGVKVNGNQKNGINVSQQSILYANAIESKSNSGWGVTGDDGSSIICNNSAITNNSSGAIHLSFGARSTLNGNTISPTPISCDSSVLSRGNHLCP